jgi:hypothetical protein
VLIDLIKLNGKKEYWNSLLRIERQHERDDHNTLMIYRLMYDTQAMKEDSDYIEMAQLLGDAGLPGEGAAVLNQAMSAGIVKDEHNERTRRLLNSARSRADADERGLSRLDAINQGLRSGEVKHLEEAYVYLARADVRLGDSADARRALDVRQPSPHRMPAHAARPPATCSARRKRR